MFGSDNYMWYKGILSMRIFFFLFMYVADRELSEIIVLQYVISYLKNMGTRFLLCLVLL